MPCFFYRPDQEENDRIVLTGQEARHLSAVLRMEPGNIVELFDGSGTRVKGEVLASKPDSVIVQVLSRTVEQQTQVPLTLAQAMLKGKKMDFLVQKATELGVTLFQPVLTRYCERRKFTPRQTERWQRIMFEACKQCSRPLPMQIMDPVPLDLFAPSSNSNLIMPWEGENSHRISSSLLNKVQPSCILTGPEGGFHASEVDLAHRIGFTTVSLGPRILRAETAALTCTALVQHLIGNLDSPPVRDAKG